MEDYWCDRRPKVAIYCRLSDEDHNKTNPLEDSRSIATQKAMLKDYAYKENWEIYDIYSDDDYSGADSNRPEYNRLLEDAKEGKFDIVLCKHQSRFTRDMLHVQKYINEKFEEWGIRYVSLLDGADTAVAGNKKSRQINGLVNEWYLEDLSENVRRAYITRKKEGKYLASCAVYGYVKDPKDNCHLIIDEPAATIVRRIFKESIEGLSLRAIAEGLNRDGVLSPTRYKTEVQGLNFKGTENLGISRRYKGKSLWHSSSVNRILKNEVYIGNLCQNKYRTVSYKNHKRITLPKEQWIVVENTHDPIISKEDFEFAAYGTKKRSRGFTKARHHIFTGKLVCGKCGSAMHCNCIRGENVYYRCSLAKELKACKGVCVSERLLCEKCLKELNCLVQSFYKYGDISEASARSMLEEKDEIKKLEKEILEIKDRLREIIEKKEKLYSSMIEEKISVEDYYEFSQIYNEKKEIINSELKKAENEYREKVRHAEIKEYKRKKVRKLIDDMSCGNNKFESLTEEMVRNLVDYVEVYDGGRRGEKEIKIYWNL